MKPDATTRDLVIRDVAATDRDQWAELFRAYREFYKLHADEGVVDTVWAWLMDRSHPVGGVVAELVGRDGEGDQPGALVGLAHHRLFPRPSTGTVGIWLDDLYTSPRARGTGIGRALLAEVGRRAGQAGCSVVRGITASSNATAQRLYDSVAQRTDWVVYDSTPNPTGRPGDRPDGGVGGPVAS